ncbi:MAG TPA: class I SAM-dependent methyltransferase [Candidatus Paceibacterota bacterium]|nr:class I SAM-dependent methyltransferase [Candidatus Paceibacterota bacterium]
MTRERLDAYIAAHGSAAKTLDIGSAHSPYARHFPNRVSLDIKAGPGVDIVADAHDLPLPDASFEQILATEVLEHLHTPERAVAEMARVLAPGGRVILTTRFIFPLHDEPHDYFRYTKHGLRYLFRDWEIESLEAEASDLATLAILTQRLSFQLQRGLVSRALLGILARVLHSLVDTKREGIMPSGYYLIARKRAAP